MCTVCVYMSQALYSKCSLVMHIPIGDDAIPQRFANAHVVKTYCYLLKEYRTNTDHTNHCIIKMLHRIAFQLKMSPLLYQLSVFRIFQSIFDEPDTSRMKVRN